MDDIDLVSKLQVKFKTWGLEHGYMHPISNLELSKYYNFKLAFSASVPTFFACFLICHALLFFNKLSISFNEILY